jgi:hypothetical protein
MIVWTEETRDFVLPRRAHGVREALPKDEAAAALIAKVLDGRRAMIENGADRAAEDAGPLQRAALAALDDGASANAEAAAASALLLTYEIDPRTEATGEAISSAFVDHWIATRGAAFAVEACVATALLGVRRDPTDRSLVLLRHRAMQYVDGSREDVERRWKALRARLSTMPDPSYEEARAVAAKVFEEGAPPLRLAVRLAYAFPDAKEWGALAARAVLAGPTPSLFAVTLQFLADRSLVEQVIGRSTQGSYQLFDAAFDLVDALGHEAAPSIMAMTDRALRAYCGVPTDDARDAGLTALTLLRTREVVAWFVARMSDRRVLPFATTLFTRAPRFAIEALARAAVAKKRTELEALLARLVRRAIEDANVALADLDGPARALVTNLIARNTITSEVSLERTPPVLATPPWATTQKKTKAKPKPKASTRGSIELPRYEETLSYDHVEAPGVPREELTHPNGEQEFRAQMADGRCHSLWRLGWVPRDAALALFREVPANVWYVHTSQDLAIQLARFGLPAVDSILRFAATKPVETAIALAPVDSPRAASVMAHVFARVRRERRLAERWLVRHPHAAAVGLIVDLFDEDAKKRANAGKALRFLSMRGHRAAIDAALEERGDAEITAVALDALGSDPALPAKPPKLPAWFDETALPRLRLAETREPLSLLASRHLGEMLAFTDSDEPYAGIEMVRDACDEVSLGDFVWDLFDMWMNAGAPAEEKWAFFALGHFGRDEHAHRIAALVRGWPTEGAFARAVMGLDVLATLRSDVSLMLLHGISEKVKSRPLLKKAQEKIESVAESLGLLADDLADRLVPTLGLDDDGSRTLDFGGEAKRRFRVGFDESLRPFVQTIEDSDDKPRARLKDLPKAGKGDDEETANSAHAEWKALKKAAKLAAAQQIERFEVAMIGGRRWEKAAFETYLVRHPLVRHLVRRLAWSVVNAEGEVIGTFRVAEDCAYAGPDDETFVLPDGARIGVLHPLEVDPSALAMWGERFGDYEILQPFAQLSREVPRDVKTEDLTRFKPVDTLKLLGLERRGWRRGRPEGRGLIAELEKEAGAFAAKLTLDPGIYAGDPTSQPTQTLQDVDVRAFGSASDPSPIFVAEVVADLRAVGALF